MPYTCFVIMGFHQKTDFATGRVLDLDKTYRNIIKPAALDAGIEIVERADEVRHSGIIDVPMYQRLLNADVAIADLSTSNANALYELGVRHALRPYSTVVMAENKMTYPFDVNHTAIFSYEHLGNGIDYDEVQRAKAALTDMIKAILGTRQPDSPVYTFLPTLRKPSLPEGAEALASAATAAQAAAADATGPTVNVMLEQANAAMDRSDFEAAKTILTALQLMRPKDRPRTTEDDFLVQRLALATYKSAKPDKLTALEAARQLLAQLEPDTTNDTETLGLWGAVRKRMWDETKQRPHLDASVMAYERGFYLRNDYYNGINLAYLLNLRASVSETADAIADYVQANRVRRQVVDICQKLLPPDAQGGKAQDRYWIMATLAEAYLGLGDGAQADAWLAKAKGLEPPGWMVDATTGQMSKLRDLIGDSPLKYIAKAP